MSPLARADWDAYHEHSGWLAVTRAGTDWYVVDRETGSQLGGPHKSRSLAWEYADRRTEADLPAADPLPKVGPLTLRQWALDQVEIANEALAEAKALRGAEAPRLAQILGLPAVRSLLKAGAYGHAATAIVEELNGR